MSGHVRLLGALVLGVTTLITAPSTTAAGAAGAGETLRFGAPTTYWAGIGGGSDIAAGRVDQDGRADVVFGRAVRYDERLVVQPSTFGLLLAEPGDGFAAPIDVVGRVGIVTDLTTADLDGDALMDVLTLNLGQNNPRSTSSIDVTLADGTGGFFAQVTYLVTSTPTEIVTADLDADGDIDVVTNDLVPVGSPSGHVLVSFNNGDGALSAPVVYDVPPNLTAQVVAGDFDGDGDVDLVATGIPGYVALLDGNGDGTFQPFVEVSIPQDFYEPDAADLDSDGDAELLLLSRTGDNGFLVVRGSPSGLGSPEYFATPDPVTDLAIADFDADGRIDVAATGIGDPPAVGGRRIFVFRGSAVGGLTPPQVVPTGSDLYRIAVADIDGDGRLDLVGTSQAVPPPYTGYSPDLPQFVTVLYGRHSAPAADLSLTTDCQGVALVPGEGRPCTVTVTNRGARPAVDVAVTGGRQQYLDDSLVPTPSEGSCVPGLGGGVLFQCQLSELAPGRTVTIAIQLAPSALAGPDQYVAFTPTAYAETADRTNLNNSVALRLHTAACTIDGGGTVIGTEGRDILCGNPNDNVFEGRGGNDVIYARRGNDRVDGGAGDDIVFGSDGDDVLLGGDGDDLLYGGEGADAIDGGAGTDDCRPEGGTNPPTTNCP